MLDCDLNDQDSDCKSIEELFAQENETIGEVNSQNSERIDETFALDLANKNTTNPAAQPPTQAEWKSWQQAIDAQDFTAPFDQAVFWTGYLEGNKERAIDYALRRNKMVLEMTPGGKWLERHQLYDAKSCYNETDADSLWYHVSEKYVKAAKGHVVAFVTREKNPNSIYQSKEKPYLLENAEVFLSEVIYESPDHHHQIESNEQDRLKFIQMHSQELVQISKLLDEAQRLWESISNTSSFHQNKKRFLKSSLIEEISRKLNQQIQLITNKEFHIWKEKFNSFIGLWDSLHHILGDLEFNKVVEAQVKQSFNVRNHLQSITELINNNNVDLSNGMNLKNHFSWLKEYSQFMDYQIFRQYRNLQNEKGNELANKWKWNVRRYEESFLEDILKSDYKTTALSKEEQKILDLDPKIRKILKAIQEIPSLGYNLSASDRQLQEQEKWNYLYDLLLRNKIMDTHPDSNSAEKNKNKEFWKENIRYFEEAVVLQTRITEKAYKKAIEPQEISEAAWQNAEEDIQFLLLLFELVVEDSNDFSNDDEEIQRKVLNYRDQKETWQEVLRLVNSKVIFAKMRSAWKSTRTAATRFRELSNFSSVSLASELITELKNAELLSQRASEMIAIEKGNELKQVANLATDLLNFTNFSTADDIGNKGGHALPGALFQRYKENDELIKKEMNLLMNEMNLLVDDTNFRLAVQAALNLLKKSPDSVNKEEDTATNELMKSRVHRLNLQKREIVLSIVEEILAEEKMRLQENHQLQVKEMKEKVNIRLQELQETSENSTDLQNELNTIGTELVQEATERLTDNLKEVVELEEETQIEKQIVEEEKLIDELSAPEEIHNDLDAKETKEEISDLDITNHQKKLNELQSIREQRKQQRQQEEKEKENSKHSQSFHSKEEKLMNSLVGEENTFQIQLLKAEAEAKVWFTEPKLLVQFFKESFSQAVNYAITKVTTRSELTFIWEEAIKRRKLAQDATSDLIKKLEILAANAPFPQFSKLWTDFKEKAVDLLQEIDSISEECEKLQSDAMNRFETVVKDEKTSGSEDDLLEAFHASLIEAEEMEEEARAALLTAIDNQLPKAWKWYEEVAIGTQNSWNEAFEKIPKLIPTSLKKVAAMKLKKESTKVTDQVAYWERKMKFTLEKLKIQGGSANKPALSLIKSLLMQLDGIFACFPTDISSEETSAWRKEKEFLQSLLSEVQSSANQENDEIGRAVLPEHQNLSPIIEHKPLNPDRFPVATLLDPFVINLMETALRESLEKMKPFSSSFDQYSLYTIPSTFLKSSLESIRSVIAVMIKFAEAQIPTSSLTNLTLKDLQEQQEYLEKIELLLFPSSSDHTNDYKSIRSFVISLFDLWKQIVIDQFKPTKMITFLEEILNKYSSLNEQFQKFIAEINLFSPPSSLSLSFTETDRNQIVRAITFIGLILNIWEIEKENYTFTAGVHSNKNILTRYDDTINKFQQLSSNNFEIICTLIGTSNQESFQACQNHESDQKVREDQTDVDDNDNLGDDRLFLALELEKLLHQRFFWQRKIPLLEHLEQTKQLTVFRPSYPDQLIQSTQQLFANVLQEETQSKSSSIERWQELSNQLHFLFDNLHKIVRDEKGLTLESFPLPYYHGWKLRERWRRKMILIDFQLSYLKAKQKVNLQGNNGSKTKEMKKNKDSHKENPLQPESKERNYLKESKSIFTRSIYLANQFFKDLTEKKKSSSVGDGSEEENERLLNVLISMVKETARTCLFIEYCQDRFNLANIADNQKNKNEVKTYSYELQDIYQAFAMAGGLLEPSFFPLNSIYFKFYCPPNTSSVEWKIGSGHSSVQRIQDVHLPKNISQFIENMENYRKEKQFLLFPHSFVPELEKDAMHEINIANDNPMNWLLWERAEAKVNEIIAYWGLKLDEKRSLQSIYFENYSHFNHNNNSNMGENGTERERFNIFNFSFLSHSSSLLSYQEIEDRYQYWMYQQKIIQSWITITQVKKFLEKETIYYMECSAICDGLSLIPPNLITKEANDSSPPDPPWYLTYEKDVMNPLFMQMKDRFYDVNYWDEVIVKCQQLVTYWTPNCSYCRSEHSNSNYRNHRCWSSSSTLEAHGLELTESRIKVKPRQEVHSEVRIEAISHEEWQRRIQEEQRRNPPPPPVVPEDRWETPEETQLRRNKLLDTQGAGQEYRWIAITKAAKDQLQKISNIQNQIRKHQSSELQKISQVYSYNLSSFNVETLICFQQREKLLSNEEDHSFSEKDFIDELSDHLDAMSVFYQEELKNSGNRQNLKEYFQLMSKFLPSPRILSSTSPFIRQDECLLDPMHWDYYQRNHIIFLIYSLHRQTTDFCCSLYKDHHPGQLVTRRFNEHNQNKISFHREDVIIIDSSYYFEAAKRCYQTSRAWFFLYQQLITEEKKGLNGGFLLSSQQRLLLRKSRSYYRFWYEKAIFLEKSTFVINENIWQMNDVNDLFDHLTRNNVSIFTSINSISDDITPLMVVPTTLERVKDFFHTYLSEFLSQTKQDKDEEKEGLKDFSNTLDSIIFTLAVIFPKLCKHHLIGDPPIPEAVIPEQREKWLEDHREANSFFNAESMSFIQSHQVCHVSSSLITTIILMMNYLSMKSSSSSSFSSSKVILSHIEKEMMLSIIHSSITVIFALIYAHYFHPSKIIKMESSTAVDSLIHFLFLPLALMMKFSLFLNDEIEQNRSKKNQETSEDEKFFFHEIEEYCQLLLSLLDELISHKSSFLSSIHVLQIFTRKTLEFLQLFNPRSPMANIHQDGKEEMKDDHAFVESSFLNCDFHGIAIRQVLLKIPQLLEQLARQRGIHYAMGKRKQPQQSQPQPPGKIPESIVVFRLRKGFDYSITDLSHLSNEEIRWTWNLYYLEWKCSPDPIEEIHAYWSASTFHRSRNQYFHHSPEEKKFHQFYENLLRNSLRKWKENNHHENVQDNNKIVNVNENTNNNPVTAQLEKEIFQLLSQADPFDERFQTFSHIIDDKNAAFYQEQQQLKEKEKALAAAAAAAAEGNQHNTYDSHEKKVFMKEVESARWQWKKQYVKHQYNSSFRYSSRMKFIRNAKLQTRSAYMTDFSLRQNIEYWLRKNIEYWHDKYTHTTDLIESFCLVHLKSWVQSLPETTNKQEQDGKNQEVTNEESHHDEKHSLVILTKKERILQLKLLLLAWKRIELLDYKYDKSALARYNKDQEEPWNTMVLNERNKYRLKDYSKEYFSLIQKCIDVFSSLQ